MNNKKKCTEAAILNELRHNRVTLPPLSFRVIDFEPSYVKKCHIDTFIEGRWNDCSAIFGTEIRALSTPKEFTEGIALLKAARLGKNHPLLLICPFLSEKQLQELEREGINGLDLCGNGVVNIRGKVTVFRTGKVNQFRSYAPIKNIYKKNSSMICRAFLACPQFATVKQVVALIGDRNIYASLMKQTPIAFSTVSKVLSAMEQDILLERGENTISLLQPDVLLEKLSRNYESPSNDNTVSVKVTMSNQDLITRLAKISIKIKAPVVATGLSSVSRYAVMQREEKLSVYCPMAEALVSNIGVTTSSRFPNLEIVDTKEPVYYFDARQDRGFNWASPVQTYLELMNGDKRDQETAGQVRAFILDRKE